MEEVVEMERCSGVELVEHKGATALVLTERETGDEFFSCIDGDANLGWAHGVLEIDAVAAARMRRLGSTRWCGQFWDLMDQRQRRAVRAASRQEKLTKGEKDMAERTSAGGCDGIDEGSKVINGGAVIAELIGIWYGCEMVVDWVLICGLW
ncbi:hypothetical protein M0R45_002140 [Rubus argutus]|uniref:Uncharacterized protein n=1 Tax=Rubus argutus TaxID=59490 RepID=A0AAW1VK18_RUBAR